MSLLFGFILGTVIITGFLIIVLKKLEDKK